MNTKCFYFITSVLLCGVLHGPVSAHAQGRIVICKLSVLHGENMLTPSLDEAPILKIFTEAFTSRGFRVVTSGSVILSPDELASAYQADAILYQYTADLPSITFTVRQKNNIVHISNERVNLFADRQLAFERVAQATVQRIPSAFADNMFYSPSVNELLRRQMVSMYTITSDLTAEQYAKKYDLSVNRESDETLNFLIYKGEIPYLYQCVNFTGFRKYAKIQPIELTIEIDALGFSHLTGHTFPEEMPEKYFPRLEQLVAAFPLWYVHDAQFHTIQLSLGVKD